jgi:hypothetical protein
MMPLTERRAEFGGRGTDGWDPPPRREHEILQPKTAGCVLVSDNESWVCADHAFAYGTHGSTGAMTESQAGTHWHIERVFRA